MSAEPWRPANGSEGDWFESRFCDHCAKPQLVNGTWDCPIQTNAFFFDLDDPEYPPEWIMENGAPRCTAFERGPNDRQDT